ncbi:hypothetical protein [Streptomyces jumonjinensis]|uniref:hypothetical protein n=1 Tax=Streptomyces jumonjinensis TaxID=1945 RepID=UPI0037AACE0C
MATLLRVLIDQQGWNNHRAFAHQYQLSARSLAQESGDSSLASLTLSESTYERWYLGKVTPQNDARRVLAHMFGRPITQLLAEAASLGSCPPSGGEITSGRPDSECSVDPDGDAQQKGGRAVMVARRALEFAMGAERNEIGRETLDFLENEVRRIAQGLLRLPGGAVLDDLAYLQNATFRLLEGGRAKPSQIRHLYLLAALQSGMLAKASHDLGEPQSAMMQARTAAVCADQAEHQTMRAWVRGLQAAISFWTERPMDALHYARSGTAIGADLRGSVMVWLAVQEARAAALLGDAEAVGAANRRAEELRSRTSPDDLDELGGAFFFPQIRQDYISVEASAVLGEGNGNLVRRAEGAVRALSETHEAHWAFGAEAGARSALALACLQVGDLDGAARAVRPVLDLPPSHRIAGIVGSVQRVRASLVRSSRRDEHTARDLCEEIATFGVRPVLVLPR